jgi:Ca2+-binding EF-hand superfamily protein
MTNARIGGSCLIVGALCALLAEPALAVDEARLQRFFTLMDTDGDGLVSRPEFQAGKGAVFLAIDEDGSMTLSQNEMRLTPEAFKQLAGDDGVVDGEEFIATDVASFDAIDKNKDHQIDLAELVAYMANYSN